MKRYLIIYSGIVQGVGFRWSIKNLANKYNLSGYVKNLSNGNVEVQVQGDNLYSFIKESLEISRFAQIDDYVVKEVVPLENEKTFEVKF